MGLPPIFFVSGAFGTGKTTLAPLVAARLRECFVMDAGVDEESVVDAERMRSLGLDTLRTDIEALEEPPRGAGGSCAARYPKLWTLFSAFAMMHSSSKDSAMMLTERSSRSMWP